MDQKEIDQRLGRMHDELSRFVFTAARDWKRSLKVDESDRELLCLALCGLISERRENELKRGLEQITGCKAGQVQN